MIPSLSSWGFRRTLLRIIGGLALALGLVGCSMVKLGYNNLPEVAYWWLDGYVDFSEAQAPRAREALARLQQWHRSEELPRYVQWLREAEGLAGGDIGPAQACALADQGRARFEALAAQVAPALAALAQDISDAQLEHLASRQARSNEKFRKEWVRPSAAERKDQRARQLADRLETAYGRLDDAQQALLRRLVDASTWDPQRALAERQRRQADLLQVMRQIRSMPAGSAEARALAQASLQRLLASPDAAHRQLQETWLRENCALVAAMHNAMTPAQREQAARRLRGWQRDFTELASAR